jgi:hypothetical protein
VGAYQVGTARLVRITVGELRDCNTHRYTVTLAVVDLQRNRSNKRVQLTRPNGSLVADPKRWANIGKREEDLRDE